MKKNVFILLLLAVCFVSCEFKHPEVIVGTNTLTIGEETVIEVKHPRVRDIAFTLLHAEDSICTLGDRTKKTIIVHANKVGIDTIQVDYVYTQSIYDYGEFEYIPITVLPKE